jgi:hypothetical protein
MNSMESSNTMIHRCQSPRGDWVNAVNILCQCSQGILLKHTTKCRSWEFYCIPIIVFNLTNTYLVTSLNYICQCFRNQEETWPLPSKSSGSTQHSISWESMQLSPHPAIQKGWVLGMWIRDHRVPLYTPVATSPQRVRDLLFTHQMEDFQRRRGRDGRSSTTYNVYRMTWISLSFWEK